MLTADDLKIRTVDLCLEELAAGVHAAMRERWPDTPPLEILEEFRRNGPNPDARKMELTDPSATLLFLDARARLFGVATPDAKALRGFRNDVMHKSSNEKGIPLTLVTTYVEHHFKIAAKVLRTLRRKTGAERIEALLVYYLKGPTRQPEARPRSPSPPAAVPETQLVRASARFVPSKDQIEIMGSIERWWEGNGRRFVLAGQAGTGKTRLVREILNRLKLNPQDVRIVAPTNKACEVLRSKLPAPFTASISTVHRLLYRYAPPSWDGEDRTFETIGTKSPVAGTRLVVCDEASMLTSVDVECLEASYRVLYVGCKQQLPAVASGSDWLGRPLAACNLLDKPDAELNTIHRHGSDSMIREVAWRIAMHASLDGSWRKDNSVQVFYEEKGSIDRARFLHLAVSADVVLVARNATRVRLNQFLREAKGHCQTPADWIPKPGEVLIAYEGARGNDFQGNPDIPNGQQLVVDEVIGKGELPKASTGAPLEFVEVKMHFRDDPGTSGCWRLSQEMLTGKHVIDDGIVTTHIGGARSGVVRCDWGHALTVHKAQGSEWDTVLVVDDGGYGRVDKRRWVYTSLTRARKLVYVVYPKSDSSLF